MSPIRFSPFLTLHTFFPLFQIFFSPFFTFCPALHPAFCGQSLSWLRLFSSLFPDFFLRFYPLWQPPLNDTRPPLRFLCGLFSKPRPPHPAPHLVVTFSGLSVLSSLLPFLSFVPTVLPLWVLPFRIQFFPSKVSLRMCNHIIRGAGFLELSLTCIDSCSWFPLHSAFTVDFIEIIAPFPALFTSVFSCHFVPARVSMRNSVSPPRHKRRNVLFSFAIFCLYSLSPDGRLHSLLGRFVGSALF